jgi:hypothetical protein
VSPQTGQGLSRLVGLNLPCPPWATIDDLMDNGVLPLSEAQGSKQLAFWGGFGKLLLQQ